MIPARNFRPRTLSLRAIAGLAACSLALSACGLFGRDEEDQPEYYGAVEAPSLEIPEGLARPTSDSALHILMPPAPLPQRELQSRPPRVSSTSTSGNENATLRWGAEGVYLLVADSPDSVQRRLGFVIERAGMRKEVLQDGPGYRVEYWHQPTETDEGFFSRLAFWRDDAPNYSGTYHVITRPDGGKTRVLVKNSDGSEADPEASEHLLVILGERLG